MTRGCFFFPHLLKTFYLVYCCPVNCKSQERCKQQLLSKQPSKHAILESSERSSHNNIHSNQQRQRRHTNKQQGTQKTLWRRPKRNHTLRNFKKKAKTFFLLTAFHQDNHHDSQYKQRWWQHEQYERPNSKNRAKQDCGMPKARQQFARQQTRPRSVHCARKQRRQHGQHARIVPQREKPHGVDQHRRQRHSLVGKKKVMKEKAGLS